MAKPIRALELHYPMIQFLIKCNISSMRRSVSSPDETFRREMKIRRAAEYF